MLPSFYKEGYTTSFVGDKVIFTPIQPTEKTIEMTMDEYLESKKSGIRESIYTE